nr:RNA-directed DNA polymerase, eukaryota [Tanacetum cinerariifolium]
MRISESASWDRGHSTWGGWEKEIVLRLWNLDKFSFNVILFDEKLLPDLAFLVASDLDFLIDVLEAFGFGLVWCNWIRGTFCFAKASILVNGSPSNEFQFHCELKQGDPLSPYLFILIMESLHLFVSRAINEGLFKGIHLQGSLSLSYLFYADDALFIGEWSDANLRGIIHILKCFFLASGLQININKSQVLGVGVPRATVEAMAIYIGCSIMQQKFRYLGVLVGECMSRHKAWDDVVLKLRSRLSKWKAKTLSIGGRLTLLKSVLGAYPLYTMSIFKVPKGVLKGDKPFCDAFPRIFTLELNCQVFVAEKLAAPLDVSLRRSFTDLSLIIDFMSLTPYFDRWVSSVSSDGDFSVKEVRNVIDDLSLPTHSESTRWVKGVPIKINIFAWRARRDCLPTRINLIRRGITLESSSCPLCLTGEEDVSHVLFRCSLARAVLRRVCRWWDLVWQSWSSFSEWSSWFSSIRLSSKVKSLLKGVFYVALWYIWGLRNRSIFDSTPPTRSVIFDDISKYYLKNQPLNAIVPPAKEGNITMSNSYVALDDESGEDVENVYDESANLLISTRTDESSSTFTVAVG